jgi:hypothetical protein
MALVISIFACDPGINYDPKDWASADYKFSKSFGQMDVEMPSLGGLIGRKWLMPEMTFRNRGKSPAVLESALLKAHGSEYPAKPFGEGETHWEPIPPGETRRLGLNWDFEQPIYEILKDPVSLTLTVKVGDERTQIDIPMIKSSRP